MGGYIRLSNDKQFCMQEMMSSMQNSMEDTAWPKTQYLWSLHPIFNWVNDKGGLLFGRGEAPIIRVSQGIKAGEMIFVMTGSIPNTKSTPLVDEWFGIKFNGDKFEKTMPINDVVQLTTFRRMDIPNQGQIFEDDVAKASALRCEAVEQAKQYLKGFFDEYQKNMGPMLDEEIDKLATLEDKHKVYQLALFENERKKSEQERKVDELFNKFTAWVTDTLTIKDNPYIRVIAVFVGA